MNINENIYREQCTKVDMFNNNLIQLHRFIIQEFEEKVEK